MFLTLSVRAQVKFAFARNEYSNAFVGEFWRLSDNSPTLQYWMAPLGYLTLIVSFFSTALLLNITLAGNTDQPPLQQSDAVAGSLKAMVRRNFLHQYAIEKMPDSVLAEFLGAVTSKISTARGGHQHLLTCLEHHWTVILDCECWCSLLCLFERTLSTLTLSYNAGIKTVRDGKLPVSNTVRKRNVHESHATDHLESPLFSLEDGIHLMGGDGVEDGEDQPALSRRRTDSTGVGGSGDRVESVEVEEESAHSSSSRASTHSPTPPPTAGSV